MPILTLLVNVASILTVITHLVLLGTVLVHSCRPGGIITRATFHSQKCFDLDHKMICSPKLCAIPHGRPSFHLQDTWVSGSDGFAAAEGEHCVAGPEGVQTLLFHRCELSRPTSAWQTQKSVSSRLHAGEHVAASAGGKLRLGEEENVVFYFPFATGRVFWK